MTLGAAGEDAAGFDKDYEWMLPVALESARPMSFGLIQNLAYPDVWKGILDKVERAAEKGARIVPQVAVRSVGILMGLGTSISPLTMFPAGFELIAKSFDEQLAALRDPSFRAQAVESMRGSTGDILGGMATLKHVFPLNGRGVRAYETDPERSIVALSERTGKPVAEIIIDHLLETQGKGFFLVPLFNPDLDAAGAMLAHPLTGIGLGDSGAHTSQTCDASYSTFLLAYWVRERKLFGIERAIRKLAFDPALMWGLHDRGLLRHGAYADVNVIDLDRLDITMPELRHEFPAGAPHLTQGSVGYDATVVNGKILMRGGEHTGALPGTVLRNELYRA